MDIEEKVENYHIEYFLLTSVTLFTVDNIQRKDKERMSEKL